MSNVPQNPLDTIFGIESNVKIDEIQDTEYITTTEKVVADAVAGEVVGVETPNAKDEEDLEMSKNDVKDLKNELLNSTPDESSGVIVLVDFDNMLTDLGLNIKSTVYKSNIY